MNFFKSRIRYIRAKLIALYYNIPFRFNGFIDGISMTENGLRRLKKLVTFIELLIRYNEIYVIDAIELNDNSVKDYVFYIKEFVDKYMKDYKFVEVSYDSFFKMSHIKIIKKE